MTTRDAMILSYIKEKGEVTVDDIIPLIDQSNSRSSYVIANRRLKALTDNGYLQAKTGFQTKTRYTYIPKKDF